jgi:hypothetical protein
LKCIHRPTVPVSIIIIAEPFSSTNGINGLDCPTPVALPPPEVKVTTKHHPFGFLIINVVAATYSLISIKFILACNGTCPRTDGKVFIEYGLNHGPFVSSRKSVDPCGGSYQVCYVGGVVCSCWLSTGGISVFLVKNQDWYGRDSVALVVIAV